MVPDTADLALEVKWKSLETLYGKEIHDRVWAIADGREPSLPSDALCNILLPAIRRAIADPTYAPEHCLIALLMVVRKEQA